MPKNQKITFKYIFADDYNPVFANGAWGGVNPSGEITINFYLERAGLPISETHQVDEKGVLGKVLEREPQEQVIVRYVENGIVLNIEGAKIINNWLGQKIKEAEEMMKQAQTIDLKKQ
jgi:hypothetical protein